ncbi:MAG: hypothetical protein EPO21_13205 [Chloroflexota bacterium]|nr:MAG: hypothetical protein EPO21_13205 [Chloroflexota bacterium]
MESRTLNPGSHINAWTPEAKESVRRSPGRSILILSTAVDREMCQWWRQAVPHGDMVARLYEQYQGIDKPQDRADALCRAFEPIQDLLTAVIVPGNEMRQRIDQLPAFADYTCQVVEILRRRGFADILGGAFSTTKPAPGAIKAFVPALELLDGYVSHEYARSLTDQGGLLHYRTWYNELPAHLRRKPLYITETGIDDDQGGGYRRHATPAEFAQLMRSYFAQLAADGIVRAVMLYLRGTLDPTWWSWDFSLVPELEALLAERFVSTIRPIEGGATVAKDEIAVGTGIKAAMDAFGDKPKTAETWVGHLGSYAEGELNEYHYNKERNKVFVSFPFAQR